MKVSFDLRPEDPEHVYVEKWELKIVKVKIPADSVKCPDCHGSGRIRIRYSEPPASSMADWMNCLRCHGKGFVEKRLLQK